MFHWVLDLMLVLTDLGVGLPQYPRSSQLAPARPTTTTSIPCCMCACTSKYAPDLCYFAGLSESEPGV